jgi:peptidyl-prolyl cis-trans isomerase D
MFDLFRSRDKVVRIMLGGMLLLVALSMLTYLIPSYNSGGGSASDVVVAQIGKDTLTLPEVQQVIQMSMRGRQMPPEIMSFQVPRIVDNLVTERALAFEAQRLGFKISDQELAAAIRQTLPQLFQDGKFAGKEAYAAMLGQQNITIQQFESDMQRQLLVTKMRDIALEGTVVTPQEIDQEYKRRNEKVRIQYVKISPDKVSGEVKPTPEELRKYYDGNKALYQTPEKRNLGVIVIDQAKLGQTIQPSETDLLRVYNENKDSYRTPERVNVRHILLKTTEKDAKQEAAVKAKADDLVKQLRAGANFAEMAKKYSEDPGSAAKGGEYDGVVRGQMVPEFEKAAFTLKPGEISDPVKTTYGYHILQVISHEQAQLKPFAELKAQLAEEYKKQRVNELMQQTSDKAEAALRKDPKHPDKVATDLGVQYVKADNIGAGDIVPDVGTSKEFTDSIETLKQGEVSQAVLVTGNKIALAVCTGLTAAHPAGFDEVQEKVRQAVTRDKTNKLLEDKANQLAAKARANGGDLEAAAKSMGLEMKTSEPVDRAGSIEGLGSASMLPDAFAKPAGTVFGPNGIADSRVVGKVLEHIAPDPAGLAAQRASIRDQIKGQKSQSRNTLFEEGVREALTKEGKVKVHQDVLDRLIANYRG